jgi:hypothetical protein
MTSRTDRENKRRKKKTRLIKVVQGGSQDISTKRLEIAKSQLVHAQLLAAETRISFNFVQRLVNEVLRRRREEAILMSEIENIISEVESEQFCDSCGIGCVCQESICELGSEDLLPDDEFCLGESGEVIIPDDSDFLPAFESDDDIDDYSRLDESARIGQRLHQEKKDSKKDGRKGWDLPL